jgi:YbgC/YbaW family acyl-CoA thioester hydrolase
MSVEDREPFSTRITVAFGDTDPAGFVYYPNLFHYCHIAFERFCTSREFPYPVLVNQLRIGFPTVNIESQFFVPLIYGDEVEIRIDVLEIGRSSITLSYSLQRSSDSVQCASATMVHVAMSLDTRRPVEIPEKFRRCFM